MQLTNHKLHLGSDALQLAGVLLLYFGVSLFFSYLIIMYQD
jgi:hypothetical protein